MPNNRSIQVLNFKPTFFDDSIRLWAAEGNFLQMCINSCTNSQAKPRLHYERRDRLSFHVALPFCEAARIRVEFSLSNFCHAA
jgi:hypothetical protein